MKDMTNVVSKILTLGAPLEDVIKWSIWCEKLVPVENWCLAPIFHRKGFVFHRFSTDAD
jgi:hypothetical protein